ncbi:hypothetical protein E4U41_005708 [Claviceps citrina]|nr:hypothetical protein E4U41_005708 [Claviceps citrina]
MVSEAEIIEIIHHVFLPPRLPQSGHDEHLLHDQALLAVTSEVLGKYRTQVEPDLKGLADVAHEAIRCLGQLRDDQGHVDETGLRLVLDGLAEQDGFFPIPVQAQNAAILVSRAADSVTFEFFELAPRNRDASGTRGRLKRVFPASAISIPLATFKDDEFQSSLVGTICKMSHQEVNEMKPKVSKAGDEHIEERDTTNPRIVTDFLATCLSALGERASFYQIEKKTREEVLWKNAKLPWRRSPLWLLLRVTIQIIFARRTASKHLYKHFMLLLMENILDRAMRLDLSSDILFCMASKISGRLLKLGGDPFHGLSLVESTLSKVKTRLQERWVAIAEQADPQLQLPALQAAEVNQDAHALYPELDEFIDQISTREVVRQAAKFTSPWSVAQLDKESLPQIFQSPHEEATYFGLLSFEDWVAVSLDQWITCHVQDPETPKLLLGVATSYHTLALSKYHGSPDCLSVMFLTIMELWVACDRSASHHHPLLLDYDPKVPQELLQSLMLPLKCQMQRLARVEHHVESRRKRAKRGNPCIFSSFGHAKSFSVCFFESSSKHQDLLRQIESVAHQERVEKREEFRACKARYKSHMQQFHGLACTYIDETNWRTGMQQRIHSYSCPRHQHLNAANAIEIQVHEWPLPSQLLHAKSTVFELQVPLPFNAWRNMTVFLIVDVLHSTYDASSANVQSTLGEYLPSFHEAVNRRLVLTSTTKSNRNTHRRGKQIATAKESDLLVQNGLCFGYYDAYVARWATATEPTDVVSHMCTHKLSKQCEPLEMFLHRPFHSPNGVTPNHVISQQSFCPSHLSLEEFKAMAGLPVGYRIAWLNILTQLHMPVVDFKKVDTFIMLLQISRQAGTSSPGTVCRASHQLLDDNVFAARLLEGLCSTLDRIDENWTSHYALSALIALASRLLSLNSAPDVSAKCLDFLQRCRSVAVKWNDLLHSKIKATEEPTQRADYRKLTFHIACVCASSFDIDDAHLVKLLGDPTEAAILIQCFMVTCNTLGSAADSTDKIFSMAVHSLKRLQYRCHSTLFEQITRLGNRSCLDRAIYKMSSVRVEGGGPWQSVSNVDMHWLTTLTASRENAERLEIHFNILSGELLFNGWPLSRLPANYEIHPMYKTLFSNLVLEVVPTDNIPGMQFSSKELHCDYALCFGLGGGPVGPEFLLTATKAGESWELVPSRVFHGRLPRNFIDNYIHWYNRNTRTVELRPKTCPWRSSSQNWTMKKMLMHWTLNRHERRLVSITSSSAIQLCRLFEPLETIDHIHVILDAASAKIDLEMPRLKLDFFYDLGGSPRLSSRQYRGMHLDQDQKVGTLVGLQSKLVLRNEQRCRKLLLVDGPVSWTRSKGHLRVFVPCGTSNKVHAYDVDELLGRLIDNGSLHSKLILCHLHALTSYCLPDLLTGRTGTEEALSILDSAAVRSFDVLSPGVMCRLKSIADVSPARVYYPSHMREMESVSWDQRLSFLSQRSDFNKAVRSIFAQASATRCFHPDVYTEPPELKYVDAWLEERHLIRTCIFHVRQSHTEYDASAYDVAYKSRDGLSQSERSARAFEMSSMVSTRRQSLHRAISPCFVDDMWQRMSTSDAVVAGAYGPLSINDICYDASWLGDQDSLLQKAWCPLHRILNSSRPHLNRFQVMMCIAALAYSKSGHSDTVQTLGAIYNVPSVGCVSMTTFQSFDISEGRVVKPGALDDVARQNLTPISRCPERKMTRNLHEEQEEYENRRDNIFRSNQDRAVEKFVHFLQNQWVVERLQRPNHNDIATYIKVPDAMAGVEPQWTAWFQNHYLYKYFTRLFKSIEQCTLVVPPTVKRAAPKGLMQAQASRPRPFLTEEKILLQSSPSLPPDLPCHNLDQLCPAVTKQGSSNGLEDFVKDLETAWCGRRGCEQSYIQDLKQSLLSLQRRRADFIPLKSSRRLGKALQDNMTQCQSNCEAIYNVLKACLSFDEEAESSQNAFTQSPNQRAAAIFMLPRICPSLFLRQLTHARWRLLPAAWKTAVVAYALSLTQLQRSKRLLKAHGNESDFMKELVNRGHCNWRPWESPETLLLEVESGILVREVQEKIAALMREPPESVNATMQLIMGEGKSSVIVPIVAASLADGSRLVCIMVTKAQTRELFRILASRLSGLLHHRIYQLPFSRSLRLTEGDARGIHEMLHECMETGGILLVQPENLLSLKLMAVECQATGRGGIGGILLAAHHFIATNAQMVIDESDENLSPKFELVYTMGTQRAIELSPDRWVITQRVLSIVASVVPEVQRLLPQSIEVGCGEKGSFPRTRILRPDAQNLLLSRVAERICALGLPGLPVGRQSSSCQASVFSYIHEPNLSSEEASALENNSAFFDDSTRSILLLLRGLIAGGVLGFAFGQKRWRVNYGLDPTRKPSTGLAVPYRAKDSPTARSEFSQPDVVIILTCLSYYYQGLSAEALGVAFEHLTKSDQADIEYQCWVQDAPSLPRSFQNLSGVNMKDSAEMSSKVFPHLRLAKSVIDYYLGHVVFPKEMKEFPQKLSASGWDIGQRRRRPTTGFSGTNDARHLLPLDVRHLHLEEQQHTNALILKNILHPDNTVELLPRQDDSSLTLAEVLLRIITSTQSLFVEVILDVGAQILELTNIQVARTWLGLVPDDHGKEAAIFFDEDELSVVDRHGSVEPLQTSPYAEKLDVCLVFLDEAHTRGTDLRLPQHYRAAVTLGAKLTKDKLVQACMRMRKLGNGQSLMFCVPDEIQSKIRAIANLPRGSGIRVSDVLIWAVSETIEDLRKNMPLWAMQGRRYQRQEGIWSSATGPDGLFMTQEQAAEFLEPEAQTLEVRYRPGVSFLDPGPTTLSGEPDEIVRRCDEFGISHFGSATLQEEQERELSPEVEQEKQIERPQPVEPAAHSIHPHIKAFVATGKIRPGSPVFVEAFLALSNTSVAKCTDLEQFPTEVLVTADYARTVQLSQSDSCADSYQRPIQWILTRANKSQVVQLVVIISPHEAQELLPDIEKSKHVNLHLYSPRSNLAFPAQDALKLYTIPALQNCWQLPTSLRLQLNLFAGQLYFGSFQDYKETCEMMGLAWGAMEDGVDVSADGFVAHGHGPGNRTTRFKKSPVMGLKVLLTIIRRDCGEIDKTHWGRILGGEVLSEADFAEGGECDHGVSFSLPVRSR